MFSAGRKDVNRLPSFRVTGISVGGNLWKNPPSVCKGSSQCHESWRLKKSYPRTGQERVFFSIKKQSWFWKRPIFFGGGLVLVPFQGCRFGPKIQAAKPWFHKPIFRSGGRYHVAVAAYFRKCIGDKSATLLSRTCSWPLWAIGRVDRFWWNLKCFQSFSGWISINSLYLDVQGTIHK